MVKTCKFVSSLVLNLILKVSCAIYNGTLAGLQPASEQNIWSSDLQISAT